MDPADLHPLIDAWLASAPGTPDQAETRHALAIALGLHSEDADDRAFGASRPRPGGAKQHDSKPVNEGLADRLRALAQPDRPTHEDSSALESPTESDDPTKP
jgi:hypothetical protein